MAHRQWSNSPAAASFFKRFDVRVLTFGEKGSCFAAKKITEEIFIDHVINGMMTQNGLRI